MPITKDDTVVRLLKDGASSEIYFYGATVTSWKAAAPGGDSIEERLWMSKSAILDGTAPIRGGIPIAFPIFAVDVHPDYPDLGGAHGFARISKWKLDQVVVETDAEIKIIFRLSPNALIAAMFPHPFELAYEIALTKYSLTTTIHVINPLTPDSSEWRFNTCLHTYYQVPNSVEATISPLKGVTYIDRLNGYGMSKEVEQNDAVSVKVETARAYDLKGTREPFQVLLSYGDDRKDRLEVTTNGFHDAVLWNPREITGSKVPDIHSGGWDNFLCWEPGVLTSLKILQPGEKFVGVQRMVVTSAL